MTAPRALAALEIKLVPSEIPLHATHPLHKFVDTTRMSMLECNDLLDRITAKTLIGQNVTHRNRRRQIEIFIRGEPPLFQVGKIVLPNGEPIWGRTFPQDHLHPDKPVMRLHEGLVFAWLRKKRSLIPKVLSNYYLLSFALRIVILHEFMHAMMIRFRPGNRTPTEVRSPSVNRKEAGYWVEYWLSGVGHAMFVYPTRIPRNPDDPPISFNKLRRIHFIADTEHYIEFKPTDIWLLRPLAAGQLRPFPTLRVRPGYHWVPIPGEGLNRYSAQHV